MAREANPDAARARCATREEVPPLLSHSSEEVLAALLENPLLDEAHLCLLLERKELPGRLLEVIARRKQWLRTKSLGAPVPRAAPVHAAAPDLGA